MVRTRRTALEPDDEASDTAAESSDKVRGSQSTKRRTKDKPTPHIVTTRNTRKRKQEDTRQDVPPAKRAAPRRPVASRPSKTVVDDEHADDVPDDALLKDINEKAAHKPRTKRTVGARQEEDLAAEDQLLRESQATEEVIGAQDEEEDTESRQEEDTEEPNSDEEGTADGKGSAATVEQGSDDEVAGAQQENDTDGGDNNGHVPAVTSSADPRSSQIENLENIARIDVISTDMAYIEPERQGRRPLTFLLKCDGLNSMIKEMGKKGWMDEKNEWANELLRVEEGSDAETESEWQNRHSAVIKTENGLKLFREIMSLWQQCKDIPKASALEEQSQYLRTNSRKIQAKLANVRHLTSQITDQGSRPLENNSKKRKAAARKQAQLLSCVCQGLMPALVLALKEALLLGGYYRVETNPETIRGQTGQFMACTLQFALHIVGFIDKLYKVVSPKQDADDSDEPPAQKKQRSRRLAFGNHLRVLEPRIVAGMEELKRLAWAPVRQIQQVEQTKRARQVEAEMKREIREQKDRQWRRFVASTWRPPKQPPEEPPEEAPEETPEEARYYEEHGWRVQEDKILLEAIRAIRKTKSPDMSLDLSALTAQMPRRTRTEVQCRIGQLRKLMKAKFEVAKKEPPKWCYD